MDKTDDDVIEDASPCPENEQQKIATVEEAHAVVNPGAVMVHQQDTSTARFAVVCSRWSGVVTFTAEGRLNETTALYRIGGLQTRRYSHIQPAGVGSDS